MLEGRIDGPVLVVQPSLLSLFSDDSLLPSWIRLCWDVCHLSWGGQEDVGGSGNYFILFGRKNEAKLAVLASTVVTLDRHRVHCQKLMGILDGGILRFAGVLLE